MQSTTCSTNVRHYHAKQLPWEFFAVFFGQPLFAGALSRHLVLYSRKGDIHQRRDARQPIGSAVHPRR